MKRKENEHRIALTLLFTIVVFIHIFLTVAIVGLLLYLLIQFGILTGSEQDPIPGTQLVILFVLASLLVGGCMTFFLSKLLLKPVNAIINSMNRLAAGDYKARIRLGTMISKHTTFKEFNDSFNRMAKELDSTEMLRSDFINNFSHEFKTPIVSIAGFAKLLKAGNLSEDQKLEYLAIIEDESLRLSQMATNVLNLTKVETQSMLTDVTTYNLSEQIRSCILLLTSKWENKELDFLLDFPEYDIRANEELMKQVWVNLVDNAIKFSNIPGEIWILIDQLPHKTRVMVTNAGPAIPEDKHKKLFNKFYQVDESHAAEGNGVGLAVVKRVVELHGGTVDVECLGGHTTFTVTLPQ